MIDKSLHFLHDVFRLLHARTNSSPLCNEHRHGAGTMWHARMMGYQCDANFEAAATLKAFDITSTCEESV